MKASREKSEGIVEERKPFSPFVNTSFYVKKLLPPRQQSVTYSYPFLISGAFLHPAIERPTRMMSK